MKEISIKDLESANVLDEISEFLFGIDSILERMILQYIYSNKNYIASYKELELEFVEIKVTCSSRRLTSRLDSLVKFKFINRTTINNNTFYAINNEWLLEIKKKNSESY